MTEECSSGRPPYKERQLRAPIRLCRTKTVLLAKPGMMVTNNHQPSDELMQVQRNLKHRCSLRDPSQRLHCCSLGSGRKPNETGTPPPPKLSSHVRNPDEPKAESK